MNPAACVSGDPTGRPYIRLHTSTGLLMEYVHPMLLMPSVR